MRLAPSTLWFITLLLSLIALALPPDREAVRPVATVTQAPAR